MIFGNFANSFIWSAVYNALSCSAPRLKIPIHQHQVFRSIIIQAILCTLVIWVDEKLKIRNSVQRFAMTPFYEWFNTASKLLFQCPFGYIFVYRYVKWYSYVENPIWGASFITSLLSGLTTIGKRFAMGKILVSSDIKYNDKARFRNR